MGYLAYHFTVTPADPGSEILVAVLADMGFESFDYNEKGFSAYIPDGLNHQIALHDLRFDDFEYTYTIEKIETVNWNAEWEKNFEPVVLGDLLNIRAPFHEPNKTVQQEIVIMPKMSFGTGHHQTTRLMCAQMFITDFSNKRVLDMGCGTAVLAILAKKLGASEVVGIDIDEWSVENSLENCRDNGFPDIVIEKGDVSALATKQPFDIILANINKNILKADMSVYTQKLRSTGFLFLSGFFTTDVDELKQHAERSNLEFVLTRHENEWAMMVLRKSDH